jgi:uncharacterized delta-60 repeat protein
MPTIPSSKQSIDGVLVNQLDSTAYSWADTRNASSGNGLVTTNPSSMSPDAYETSGRGNNYHIDRCMLTFDFSGVSGTIVSLHLKLYKASGYTVYKDIIVVKNSNTYSSLAQLSNNDYNVDFSTPYSGDFTMGAGGAGTLKTIALNSDAKTDAVGNANFTIAICDYDHDYNNVTPLLTLNNYATFYYNNSSYYPRLEYTLDTGFGEIVNGVIHSKMKKIIDIGRLNVERVIDAPSSATIFNSNIGTAFDDYLYSIAPQSDGKFVIAGGFEAFNSNTRRGIVRLNSDGTEDTSFYTNIGTGFKNGTFRSFQYTAEIQSDGKILVGGNFDTLNGTTRNHLVRLNSNGTVDTSFYTNLGTGFNSYVRRVVIQSDGKILVAGGFSTFKGNTRRGLVRLNSNGTEDTSFYTNLGTGFSNTSSTVINTVAVQSDGKIIVGGQFTSFKGNTRNYLVRLNSNGTEDTSFYTNLGSSFSTTGSSTVQVKIVAVDSNGKILVGGAFDRFNGATRRKLVRLNSNGTADTTFNSNLGSGFNTGYAVNAITVDDDDVYKVYIGGDFWNFNGNTTSNGGNATVGLVRLNSSGTLDTSFELTGMTFGSDIKDVEITTGNSLIIGGNFTPTINGTTRNHLIDINSDGSVGN